MVAMVVSFSITAVVVSLPCMCLLVWHNIINYIYTLGTCVLNKCVGYSMVLHKISNPTRALNCIHYHYRLSPNSSMVPVMLLSV